MLEGLGCLGHCASLDLKVPWCICPLFSYQVFGCDGYPAGYPFTHSQPGNECLEPHAFGWLGAIIFFVMIIIGAYMLPTVLVGIVSISFDTAARRSKMVKSMNDEMEKVRQ